MAYMGGKSQSGVWQRILNLIPPHDVFIEPFLGSGAIMRKKRPAGLNIGRDLDTSVLARWIHTPKTALLEKFDVTAGCGIAFLESYRFTGREFVYVDPPYLHSTRGRARYAVEMTDADHSRLLAVLRGLPCPVMLSGYPSDVYLSEGFGTAETLAGWTCETFDVMTRGHTWATECLWMNYPAPAVLHDFQSVGQGWRDRQRIKRKRNRWAARIRKLPELERAALFSALVDATGADTAAHAITDARRSTTPAHHA